MRVLTFIIKVYIIISLLNLILGGIVISIQDDFGVEEPSTMFDMTIAGIIPISHIPVLLGNISIVLMFIVMKTR